MLCPDFSSRKADETAGRELYRKESARSRTPISASMNHPKNGTAVYCTPPISKPSGQPGRRLAILPDPVVRLRVQVKCSDHSIVFSCICTSWRDAGSGNSGGIKGPDDGTNTHTHTHIHTKSSTFLDFDSCSDSTWHAAIPLSISRHHLR